MAYNTQPNQEARILSLEVALPKALPDGESRDAVSAVLEEAVVAPGSVLLDWRYTHKEWEAQAPSDPEEGSIFHMERIQVRMPSAGKYGYTPGLDGSGPAPLGSFTLTITTEDLMQLGLSLEDLGDVTPNELVETVEEIIQESHFRTSLIAALLHLGVQARTLPA